MTPQERKLVEDLFERLATLERNPREPEAEELIRAGLRRAPNATYALVQTVLLQEEALRQANERIRELEQYEEPQQQQGGGGFLDSMRDAVFGTGGNRRSSVPPVGGSERPMGVPPGFQRAGDPYQTPGNAPYPQQLEPARGGAAGSFLGTAAATAAGVIGGALLMNSLKGMFGGDQAKAQGLGEGLGDASGQQASNTSASPWGDATTGGGDLAQQAGIDSIGQGGGSDRAGLFDEGHAPMDDGEMFDDGGFDMDFDL
jgi:hypothetical protein